MTEYDYDFFVIGAGSGGMRASRMAASYGARVAVAEEARLGGTCVNVGCIPKKLLVHASHFQEDFEDAAAGYGWSLGARSFDWATLIANKDREIARLNGIYDGLLDTAGVDQVLGRARLDGPHAVVVGERRITAEHILVATGGWPVRPDIPGAEWAITSNEAFELEAQPPRILIVGGGYIAVEFAGIFRGLGSEVTQVYRGPLFLRGFDDDVRQALEREMRRKGIDLRFDCEVEAIEQTSSGLLVSLSGGDTQEVDQVFYAIGRAPNVEGLGLEKVGVDRDDKGAIRVDEFGRSSVASIHAIGDVTDRINLTPVAIHEGMCLARTLFDGQPTSPDHRDVPSAVFSQPAIGTVGLTESEARESGSPIDVYVSEFRPLRHTLTGSEERTLMKLVVDRSSQRVLGVHVVSPDAAEIVQGFAVAVKCGATKADLDATIPIHPTTAEELVTMREPRSDPS
ncbi:MAG: glutathione-disulfide reductase [Myxococcota bacterium]|nr:glutathione-disulfide reductase [Myxococcota bacterium]